MRRTEPPLRLLAAACGLALIVGLWQVPASAAPRRGAILAVGAESQYANVIGQIGGRAVRVTAVLRNPNTDPHSFESSPSVARQIASARLIVQNGLGYDAFMNDIERATPSPGRRIVTVQRLLGLPDSTPNPHLWYSPRTMPAVARAIETALAAIAPSERQYFAANLVRFERSLGPWRRAIASFRRAHRAIAVAVSEPVADDLLNALGVRIATPFRLQADLMNGVDPAPEDIALQTNLFAQHRVRAFVYNAQVVDPVTAAFRAAAERAHVPIVAVYETMPEPGYDYQRWMLAEVRALERAVSARRSTERL